MTHFIRNTRFSAIVVSPEFPYGSFFPLMNNFFSEVSLRFTSFCAQECMMSESLTILYFLQTLLL